ncbi:MAG: iron ABC transporter permease [archaeon]|nr:iron ABC transporter permease [archaeon]
MASPRRALGYLKGRMSLSRTLEKVDSEDDIMFVFREYKDFRHSKTIFLLVFVALFIILLGYKITLGSYEIGFIEVYQTIWNHITGNITDRMADNVVWTQRLPRVLTAVFVGLGLAAAGSSMQSMMKNPLADPYTTGISSGALFGATLAMTLGIFLIPGAYGRVVNAFIFALVPALFIVGLSKWKKPSPSMMILVGIAIMYIFNAFQSFMMLKADPNSASTVYTWSVGSIGMTTWEEIPIIAAISIVGFALLFVMGKTLNALNSGDSYAKSLGVNVDHVRIICLMIISVVAAGVVSFTGIIGFIGLVSPHIARIFVGSDNRILIPASALMGACMMLLCDIIGFLVVGSTLQIGIVTAMIGGPLFMIILIAQQKEVW